jgi:plastocyanin
MKPLLILPVLTLAALTVAACGDDNGAAATPEFPSSAAESDVPGDATIELEADPDGDLAYTTDAASAKVEGGYVTVNFTNPQSETHDVLLEDARGKVVGGTERIGEGRDSASVKGMKPGRYIFFCSVPGHREAGMEGTLTVR